MSTQTTTIPPAQTTLEGTVIQLLAELNKKDPEQLRTDLLAAGQQMPVDSLDMLEILVAFRKQTGLTIPKNKLRRRTMRSVGAFAAFAATEGKR